MRLLLFDIDGTLICSSQVGREVVANALYNVFGSTGSIEQYSFAGKTDQAIILDLMTADGFSVSEVRRKMPAVFQQMGEYGRRLFPLNGLLPCPGISDLLQALSRRKEIFLGIQTGNSEETAPLKLLAAGIDPEQFSLGAFGSDSTRRNELIPIAWARAKRITGIDFTPKQTLVIGDTPADVECGKVNRAITVAVATGTYSASSLARSKPAFLLDSFADLTLSIETLIG